MAELKRIIVSLPNNLLEEVDGIVALENRNRSEFIRDAMRLYIKEREKIKMREQLKNGYMQMAEINVKFAEMGLCEDYKDFVVYETRLSECE
ncbi:CopG family ribbon-helix-helix protein [Thermoanaerobacterium sp. DL9XJH110]|uniref:CopG family ribbon-helix-helix protein n=1 Tax=Thermoanaerobacterium sp. DL9XJH110 TaxID=3386643 RepID=UPI003BB67E32